MIECRTDITATVWQIRVEVGQSVTDGDDLVVLESMKMEIPVCAPSNGVVASIHCNEGEAVDEGQVLVVLHPAH